MRFAKQKQIKRIFLHRLALYTFIILKLLSLSHLLQLISSPQNIKMSEPILLKDFEIGDCVCITDKMHDVYGHVGIVVRKNLNQRPTIYRVEFQNDGFTWIYGVYLAPVSKEECVLYKKINL